MLCPFHLLVIMYCSFFINKDETLLHVYILLLMIKKNCIKQNRNTEHVF